MYRITLRGMSRRKPIHLRGAPKLVQNVSGYSVRRKMGSKLHYLKYTYTCRVCSKVTEIHKPKEYDYTNIPKCLHVGTEHKRKVEREYVPKNIERPVTDITYCSYVEGYILSLRCCHRKILRDLSGKSGRSVRTITPQVVREIYLLWWVYLIFSVTGRLVEAQSVMAGHPVSWDTITYMEIGQGEWGDDHLIGVGLLNYLEEDFPVKIFIPEKYLSLRFKAGAMYLEGLGVGISLTHEELKAGVLSKNINPEVITQGKMTII